jgi:hypothetical protein
MAEGLEVVGLDPPVHYDVFHAQTPTEGSGQTTIKITRHYCVADFLPWRLLVAVERVYHWYDVRRRGGNRPADGPQEDFK